MSRYSVGACSGAKGVNRMADLFTEDIFLLRDGNRRLPDAPSYWTLRRYINVGRPRFSDGRMIRLEHTRLPKGMATSVEAYGRFTKAINRGSLK